MFIAIEVPSQIIVPEGCVRLCNQNNQNAIFAKPSLLKIYVSFVVPFEDEGSKKVSC